MPRKSVRADSMDMLSGVYHGPWASKQIYK